MKQVLSVKKPRRVPSLAQFRLLPRFLTRGEKNVAVAALTVAILAGGGLGYIFVSKSANSEPKAGGNYTEGVIGYPSLINPLYANVSDVDNDLAHLLYSGLMRFDPQDGLVPDLAESYQISEDGKTYTFVMRQDATFHDGNPVTPSDVVFTVNAIENPEYRSTLQSSFEGVTVEATDDKTVVFTLAEPFTPFLSFLTVGILPSHLWSEVSPSSAQLTQLNLKSIGSGPYKFAKLTRDSKGVLRSMTLTRNKEFYRGAPYIENLTFKFSGSPDELSGLLKNHNIEGAVTLPASEVTRYEGEHKNSVYRAILPQYTAAFFNMKSSGPVADEDVRKALSVGTDRQTVINTVLLGKANALVAPFFSGTPGGTPPENIPGADTASAMALLDEAGYKIPEAGGVRMKGDKPLNLTITTANTPELVAVAGELKRQWEALGASVTVTPLEPQDLQENVLKTRNFEIILAGELYGAFRDPYPYWHSSQSAFPGLNITQFTNRTGDEAITTIRTTPDAEKRATAYGDLAKIFTEQNPAVFLYQPTYAYVTDKKIKNVSIPTINLPADRFSDINEWYIKTKHVFSLKGE